MIRIISALLLACAAAFTHAADPAPTLVSNPPARHVVQAGDTLWDISAKFLREPWRWPEIWRMNRDQIKNPNRIYPGDVIVLERDADGRPFLRVGESKISPRIYEEPIKFAIPPIQPSVIEPFISAPLIVEANQLDTAPRIVATQQDRVFLGAGDTAYVENADPTIAQWQVFRNGEPLYDPVDKNVILGYEAYYLGTARQIRPGQPATFEVISNKEEIGRGNRLVPAVRPMLQRYVPHRPDTPIDGRLISIYGGVSSAGRGSIVTLNRGAQDGIEIGHVLSIERNRTITHRDENDVKLSVSLPAERVGLVFVFRTFDRISYAVVMQADDPLEPNDFVRTP